MSQNTSKALGGRIRDILDRENEVIRAAHFAGASGSETVRRRTSLIDRALSEAHTHLSTETPVPILLAVGGYGRGELNPFSDIDIMLLCRNEAERGSAPGVLYALWDAGLDIGYSVRTLDECIELARNDIKIRTSLMESRLISGDPSLFDKFRSKMGSEVFFRKVDAFIADKIADRQAARRNYGDSIYLREPNVKEGSGGLRDIHAALWAASARFRINAFDDLIAGKIIALEQYEVFSRSRDFIWRLRNGIHYNTGRKNDHLTFDMQERAAKDFGYRDSMHLLGVERFMKAYFMHARNIREFSNMVTEAALRKPSRPSLSRSLSLGPFTLIGKVLIPASDEALGRDPETVLSAFAIMQSRRASFSDNLKQMIREFKIDDGQRGSTTASAMFLSIMNSPEHLYETLSMMKDLRFLGRYVPEFRAIQSLAKHDAYHRYTVDEHTLLAIQRLQYLWNGIDRGSPSLRDALKGIKKPWLLTLAAFLHDLGKAYKSGHEHRGVDLADRILNRLRVSDADRKNIIFLVKNHLVMASLSQRRELSDVKVIADFAGLVGSRENLDLLYLLTYADISAVSPNAWTQWKAVLLHELYIRTRDVLEKTAISAEEEKTRVYAAVARIRKAAGEAFSRRYIDDFTSSLPEKYVLHTPLEKIIEHMKMADRLPEERLVIHHRHFPERGYTELTICAYDAYGMFYRTAGTLAAKNFNILRAQAHTTKSGVMIDTLQVTDPDGNICRYEDVWTSLKSELRDVLTGESPAPAPGGLMLYRNTAHGDVAPAVEFDNVSSEAFTIVDITAKDRVGFLYHLAKAMYDLNLDIASARIVTEGARVMDSFYVTDLLKRKITEPDRLDRIKEALMKALNDMEKQEA